MMYGTYPFGGERSTNVVKDSSARCVGRRHLVRVWWLKWIYWSSWSAPVERSHQQWHRLAFNDARCFSFAPVDPRRVPAAITTEELIFMWLMFSQNRFLVSSVHQKFCFAYFPYLVWTPWHYRHPIIIPLIPTANNTIMVVERIYEFWATLMPLPTRLLLGPFLHNLIQLYGNYTMFIFSVWYDGDNWSSSTRAGFGKTKYL
jgi:hypothetical protein